MARLSLLTFLALCAMMSAAMAGKYGHFLIQQAIMQQQAQALAQAQEPAAVEEVDAEDDDSDIRSDYPVQCDWVNTPKYSCYNCFTQLVCKPTGGKLKNCDRYCNDGQCSDIPSLGCRSK